MNRKKLLDRLARGALHNVSFTDMTQACGRIQIQARARERQPSHLRASGDRRVVNLQEVDGEAKPYQIRQFLRPVERYDLRLEDEP